MAEHAEDSSHAGESIMEKIAEKLHVNDSSTSSDSDSEKMEASSSIIKAKIWRFFGREQSVHRALGGGKGRLPHHRLPSLPPSFNPYFNSINIDSPMDI